MLKRSKKLLGACVNRGLVEIKNLKVFDFSLAQTLEVFIALDG